MSSRKDKFFTGKMSSLIRTLIWCCSLVVLAAAAEAAEQQSYKSVSTAEAELKKLTMRFEAQLTEISSQKQATALLLEEAQLTLREVKAQKEETDKALARQWQGLTTQAVELEEYKANMSEITRKQAEECQKAVDEQSNRLDAALLRFETWKNGNGSEEVTTSQTETEATTYSFNLETLSSTVVTYPAVKSTVAPPSEEPSTVAPTTALQAYLRSGLAGLIGKPLNIENVHYKGEFLYLARNPTNRSTSVVFYDGATLAVGEDKLRQSAFQWELVRVPGEDSSVVYLRNKLNELKPIPSKEDYYGRWDYIRIETVSSSTGGESSQLVITMKETGHNQYYYAPWLTPNTNSALNGRTIYWTPSPSYPETNWIVTLAS